MKAKEVMTRDAIATCDPSTRLPEVARRMLWHDAGIVPVVEGGRLVGVITDRDIAINCIGQGHDATRCTARDHMTRDPITISPEADVASCARLMEAEQIRRLPVVEGERLVGILSLGDIAVKAEGAVRAGETLRRVSRGVKKAHARQ